jgi:transposase
MMSNSYGPTSVDLEGNIRYMPSLVSMQYNPVIIRFCQRLSKKEKNSKVIVCAVMRKLVHLIFCVLRSGRPFDPNFELKTA